MPGPPRAGKLAGLDTRSTPGRSAASRLENLRAQTKKILAIIVSIIAIPPQSAFMAWSGADAKAGATCSG